MNNYWHNEVLGKYSPEDRWMGLDFKTLFLDPGRAKLTHVHELTHSLLSRSTEFGQATSAIFQLLPKIHHIPSEKKDLIRKKLMSVQFQTQEGIACLMELLVLRREMGRLYALNWAKQNFTSKYYEITKKLFFILQISERYRNSFTQQIPHTAMHTGIKRAIAQNELLSNPDNFISYLEEENNIPDKRLSKMLEKIYYHPNISTKAPNEICDATGVLYFPDVTKQDAADFINYMHKISGINHQIKPNQVLDLSKIDVLTEANEDIVIANMNINLAENAMVLWNIDDLLHYKDEIEVVIVNEMDRDFEHKAVIEKIIGTELQGAMIAFLKTGEKYLLPSDYSTISNLSNNELQNVTLITKWGLFKPGDNEILRFENSRKPDVVVYNNIKNLELNFGEWLKKNTTYCFIVTASENHPFQSIILKDGAGTLHYLNAFPNPINKFLKKFSDTLVTDKPNNIITKPEHYNNTLAAWCGLSFDIDWYRSMIDGVQLFHRK